MAESWRQSRNKPECARPRAQQPPNERRRPNFVASDPTLVRCMSHIFSAGHRCPARTNPESETRNPKQAPNSNDKFSKPDQSARPRRLGFEDLLLLLIGICFGFRISDFAASLVTS